MRIQVWSDLRYVPPELQDEPLDLQEEPLKSLWPQDELHSSKISLNSSRMILYKICVNILGSKASGIAEYSLG
jgi:hypothetical protein